MKIIIVGAGIAGLSTYLHLLKHLPNPTTHTLTIYESHSPQKNSPPNLTSLSSFSESTTIVGGGLGISPNGMRILRNLNSALHDAVTAQGFPVSHFVFRGANGWVLGSSPTSDATVRNLLSEEEEVCVASSRHGLRETLLRFVSQAGGKIKYHKIARVSHDTAGRPYVVFLAQDGVERIDEADLIIGADGVKSIVRSALFPSPEHQPIYTGLSGIGGFISMPLPIHTLNPPSMHFTFGRDGFFGYSPVSTEPASLMWWSTYETPLERAVSPVEIKDLLGQRHRTWKDPVIQDVVAQAEVQSVYPTWALGDLPHWGERGIVLIGDAAHALDPTTGQGASQALEDSLTLSLLLSSISTSDSSSNVSPGPSSPTSSSSVSQQHRIDTAIKLFHQIRSPRVNSIVQRGRKMSRRKRDVGVVAEYITYLFLWAMTRWPAVARWMLGDVNRELYTWDAATEVRKAVASWNSKEQ
ncbi:FAD/NAD(P)-binding domain-containing protein [Paraphaeosphaeria sporulosa]|uniref:FAD/NAD(P)-binding domain-containing protein n=1 Tax=Paraphaeosphaeria sporulosa TaxID=1460663 RepID=A0A177CZ78_9PLEO|nr:FAD/NAD(P)-binding domain-containing protein [Paraphaeosphaeria sporulosa]OAG12451.1 FAD/NAD(P)-binding domain-containing protein [Paraphaeosphaeria sporulosa]